MSALPHPGPPFRLVGRLKFKAASPRRPRTELEGRSVEPALKYPVEIYSSFWHKGFQRNPFAVWNEDFFKMREKVILAVD